MDDSEIGEKSPRVVFHLVMIRDRFRAVCSCGWQSPTVSTAGIAESAWDLHVAEDHGQ